MVEECILSPLPLVSIGGIMLVITIVIIWCIIKGRKDGKTTLLK